MKVFRKNVFKRNTFHYFSKYTFFSINSKRSFMNSNESNELKLDNVIFPLDLFSHILSNITSKLYFRYDSSPPRQKKRII